MPTVEAIDFDVDVVIKMAEEITSSLLKAKSRVGSHDEVFEESMMRVRAWINIASDFVREVSPRIENGKLTPLEKIKLRMAIIELELIIHHSNQDD